MSSRSILWYWRPLVVFLTPLLLLPIPLIMPTHYPDAGPNVFLCLYVVCWMVVYWVSEVVPLPVTAFMPLIFFPLLGIMNGKQVSLQYLKDTNFVLIGSFLMAAAVEETRLHQRIALRILTTVGSDPRLLLLGFHMAGGFLSMWIANAAVTAMLLPSALAVIEELEKFSDVAANRANNVILMKNISTSDEGGLSNGGLDLKDEIVVEPSGSQNTVNDIERIAPQPVPKKGPLDFSKIPSNSAHIYRAILLSLCYSTNIGGTATLTGTAPTIVLSGLFTQVYKNATGVITYARWMEFAMPPVVVALILSYFILLLYMQFLGWGAFGRFKSSGVGGIIRRQYAELGPMRFEEVMALVGFLFLVLIWFFRDPGFPGFKGWVSIFPNPKYISIGSATMLAAVFLFVVPRYPPTCGTKNPPQSTLLTWPVAQKKVPWGIILLVGGGYAMAEGISKSGLSLWIGSQLNGLEGFSPVVLSLITIIIAGVMTEFTSNVVVVDVLLPIVGNLATAAGINPLYLILPVVLKASFAFMLPVATPPNAIVFNSGLLKVWHMFIVGFFMNVMCTALILGTMETFANVVYPLSTYPSWAPPIPTKPTLIN